MYSRSSEPVRFERDCAAVLVHGIVLIGAMVVLGHADTTLEKALGFVAVLLGAGNAAGGYVVTERMLEMFKPSQKTEPKA